MASNDIRRFATGAAVTVGVIAGLLSGGGTAAASETVTVPMSQCFGFSPNIVDQPYAPSRAFFWNDRPGSGVLTFADVSSLWFFAPYHTETRLDWHNKTTGARGSETRGTAVGFDSGALNYRLNSGSGDIEITRSAVNSNALWAIPTNSCTGTVHVN